MLLHGFLNIVPNKITVVSVPTAIRASLPGSPKESKSLPAMQKTQVQSLGQEDPLEKGMATHSSILDWRISRTEEPGGPQFIGSKKALDTTERLAHLSRPPEGGAEDSGSGPLDKLTCRMTSN